MGCTRAPTGAAPPRSTSASTRSTACWSWDARSPSASPDPGRGRGRCGRDRDPCNTVAHARRKFVAVYKATHAPLARDVIAALSEVYAIEARIRGRSAAERRAVRQAETKPILDGLKTRLMTALAELPSRSSLVEAIKYLLGHWTGLIVFLEDG